MGQGYDYYPGYQYKMSYSKAPPQHAKVSLSVGLNRVVHLYLDFLERHTLKVDLENQHALRRIVHRYENYWLPLLKDWGTSDLEPPADVNWVWHLHLLQPRFYIKFCRERFGRVLPHHFRVSQSDESAAKERTRQIWRDKFPHEPYDLDLDKPSIVTNGSSFKDVVALSARERTFFQQVGLPHYRDEKFLAKALNRYKKFLLIHELKPGYQINPPMDIQLMWRTHLMYPVEYLEDVNRLFGRVLEFNADMTALSSHIFISGSSGEAEAWKSTYNETLFIPGTGYRGRHVRGTTIQQLPAHAIGAEVVNSCEITLDDVLTSNLWTKDKNLRIQARRLGASSVTFTPIFECKAKADQPVCSNSINGLGSTRFNARDHRGIEFHIYSEKGRGCMRAQEHLTTVFYNPCHSFDNKQFYSRIINVDIPKVTSTDPKFTFTCKVKADERKPHTFGLDREPFAPGTMPSDLKPFIATQAYWSYVLMLNRDMEFQQAEHRIKSREGEEIFSCKIVKSDDFDLAAVLLYFGRHRLVCVAHSIGVEQLPSSDQVSERCPLYMDTKEGDSAMLIRNHAGDQAICVGRWVSLGNGNGKVELRIFNLKNNTLQEFNINDDELHNIKFDDVIIDMPSGRINIAANCPDVAERVCMAFCVGMLFVTCQKKGITGATSGGSIKSTKSADFLDSSSLASRQSSNQTTTASVGGFSKLSNRMKQKKRTNRRKMSASFTFLLASGLQMDAFLTGSLKGNSRPSTISHTPLKTDDNEVNMNEFSKGEVSPEGIEVDTAVYPVPVTHQPMSMSSRITQPPYLPNGSRPTYPSNGVDHNDNSRMEVEEDPDKYMDIRL